MELFFKELDTAPLALLLWISGALIVLAPKFIADAAVSLWSILAIAMTGIVAFQVHGYEHLLPTEAKVAMVAGTLFFVVMMLAAVLKAIAREKARWIADERAKVSAWTEMDMARRAGVYDDRAPGITRKSGARSW
jgi:hypothetical protein